MTRNLEELWQAYRATTFGAMLPDGFVGIRIGARCLPLETELSTRKLSTWAYITASNPGSKLLSEQENQERHRKLVGTLEDLRCPFFEGSGVPDDAGWPPEVSLLVLGIDQQQAVGVGRQFGQVAIVWGVSGDAAELIECQPESSL